MILADKTDEEQARKPSGRLLRTFPLILMFGLTIWIAAIAIIIEAKNVEAGSYLPRNMEIDAGKWRVSREGTPRDELRALIKSVGLLQYPLSISAISLAVFHLASRRSILLAAFGVVLGVIALGIAMYRGYYSSLGL